VKLGLQTDVDATNEGADTVECSLCGSRLRRGDASVATDANGELLPSVAQHRCAPRVRARAT
jgi:hypothetical protein